MFFGTHDNKVDRKGRVSVPASFRAALNAPEENAIVAFPSFTDPAIEAWPVERMRRLQDGLDEMDQFSQEQRDFASLIFAEARLLNLDNEGRIVLPGQLARHAAITERALFVGQGATFLVWEPSRYQAYKDAARERAAKGDMTIRLSPGPRPRGE
ncbi:MAG: division/cell wall cluster transcriptional repressor MraZ [Kiloniellales bacterium]